MSESIRAAYGRTDDYEVRTRTHELYSVVEETYADWLLAQLPREGVGAVLDVGCGTGALLRQMAAAGIGDSWLGVDQSEAMVQKARALADEAGLPVEYRRGDILDPLTEEVRFNLICACHMLYHVPDIDAAIEACAQRLTRDGTFVATTNSRETMSPFMGDVQSALAARFPQAGRGDVSERFSLENGAEFLVGHFDRIELRVRRDAFRFPTPEPWSAYLKSGRHLDMPEGHTDEEWAEAAETIDQIAREQFRGGELIVPKVAGAFLCTMPAGPTPPGLARPLAAEARGNLSGRSVV